MNQKANVDQDVGDDPSQKYKFKKFWQVELFEVGRDVDGDQSELHGDRANYKMEPSKVRSIPIKNK